MSETDLSTTARVFYWLRGEPTQNFGDFLAEYFLGRLLMGPRVHAAGYRLLGSALEDGLVRADLLDADAAPTGRIGYWGCGMRQDGPLDPAVRMRCQLFGVRGPLSRDLLGLGPDTVLGDPGFLVPLLHTPRPGARTAGRSICVPHFDDRKTDEELLAGAGTDMVVRPGVANTFDALERLLDEIAGARFVLAGSLHAAIAACAYDVPFAFWDDGHVDIPFKWRDLAASIDIPAAFVANRQQGETVYEGVLRPVLRKPKLLPILEVCPFYVRPSALVAALAADGMLSAREAATVAASLRGTAVETDAHAKLGRASIARLSGLEKSDAPRADAPRDDDRLLEQQSQLLDGVAGLKEALREFREEAGGAQATLEGARHKDHCAVVAMIGQATAEARSADDRQIGTERKVLDATASLEEQLRAVRDDIVAARDALESAGREDRRALSDQQAATRDLLGAALVGRQDQEVARVIERLAERHAALVSDSGELTRQNRDLAAQLAQFEEWERALQESESWRLARMMQKIFLATRRITGLRGSSRRETSTEERRPLPSVPTGDSDPAPSIPPRSVPAVQYGDWTRNTFGREIPAPGVLFAASFEGNSIWGQKTHEALIGIELQYVDHLLSELKRDEVPGALVEFGVFNGWWVNHLFEASERLDLLRPVIGYDSFQGLSPPHPEFDEEFWQEGQYAASLESVRQNVRADERPRIQLIKGFFADSLTGPEAAAVGDIAYARIDCDIYEPALDCLRYLAPRLTHGAVLVFDDWPHRLDVGEARALAEWLPAVPNLRLEFLFFGTWGHFYTRVWHRDKPSPAG